jgi:hypothetical protein
MRPQSVTVSSVAASAPIPVDHKIPANIGFGVVMSGTLTYTVEHTFDNIFDTAVTPTWFPNTSVSAETTSVDGNYAFPVRAIRLNVTAYTSGAATLTVLQGREF